MGNERKHLLARGVRRSNYCQAWREGHIHREKRSIGQALGCNAHALSLPARGKNLNSPERDFGGEVRGTPLGEGVM